MSKKFTIITIVILLCALFLNVLLIKPTSASVTNAKIYKQRTFNIAGKGIPEEIAKVQDRMSWSKYEPTGIYVTENEKLQINVEDSSSTVLYIQSYGDYNAENQWDEQEFPLTLGQNTIPNHKSGILYLANLSTSGQVEISINGGSHIPVFEKTHSDSDFITMMAEHKKAPYVEYVSNYGLITISYKRAEQFTKDPSKLLQYIDIALEAQDKLAGYSSAALKEENRLDNHYRHLIEDAKQDYYMYATEYRTAYAQKGEAVQFIVDADKFKSDGWGPWHENGHAQQQRSWNFHEMTEVQVNLYSLVSQLALDNESLLQTGDEYKRMHDYFKLPAEQKDYDQLTEASGGVDFFLKLTMLWQLHLGLGENFYPNLHAAYRALPQAERPTTAEDRKNYFMYMSSQVAGRNLLPFFDQWGLNPSEKTRADVASLNLPLLEAKIWESTDAKPVRENINLLPVTQNSNTSANEQNKANANETNPNNETNSGENETTNSPDENTNISNTASNEVENNHTDDNSSPASANATNKDKGENNAKNNTDNSKIETTEESNPENTSADDVTDSDEDKASYFITLSSKSKENPTSLAADADASPTSGEQNATIYFIIIALLSIIAISIMQFSKKRSK